MRQLNEYLVTGDITIADMTPADRHLILTLEAAACKPFMDAGLFVRAWRTYGDHDTDHGHAALWRADDITVVDDAYRTFPLVKTTRLDYKITPLMTNPNDPGSPATELDMIPMTWFTLNQVITAGGAEHATAPEHGVWIVPKVVSVHKHPESEDPEQIHFMVHDPDTGAQQKVAELGPPSGDAEHRAPGYIDFLAQWAGRPVLHSRWVERIRRDNDLEYGSYPEAVEAARHRVPVVGY